MNLRLSNRGLWNQAVNSALIAGGLTGIALSPGQALAQTAGAPATPAPESKSEPTQLDTVEVTGSRIRRVDLETASPIFVIDRKMIETSGVQTVGELVQDLPAIAGAATNPRVNNGGGDGAATVSLRGLGSNRTLVLLNGRRTLSTNESIDVNQLPINLIERVEVLKEGASAIYGSDAIGGVVNFITRKDFTGSELSVDAGDSSRRDGRRSGVKLSFGNSAGKVNIMGGANYHNQAQITAGDRQFASHALYLYSGVVTAGGSSRTPTGRLFLTAATRSALGYPATGCSSVTRNVGAVGNDGTAAGGQYHCFSTATDLFNYQPYNLIMTPQERGNIFTVANYAVSDDVDAYTEIYFDHTRSGFQIAPLPFDSRPDGVTISAQNVYNPFNQDFGGGLPSSQNATFRMLPLGTRHSIVETNTGQINLGVKGNLFATDWRWNVGGSYARAAQQNHVDGYLFRPALVNALGPSFDNADNDPSNGVQQPTCGTANTATTGAPPPSPTIVPNCTPLDIFNLNLMVADPAQAAQLAQAAARYTNTASRTQKILTVNFDGPIVNLPAGPLQLALGAERRDQQLSNTIDFLTQGQAPLYLSCNLAQETCTNPTSGGLNVMELYGELLVPIVSNMPAAQALNLILGTRRSDYNKYGVTNNSKVALEYRPISDVLVRGSWAQVFRAPTVTDLFGGITANAPTFNDPCTFGGAGANPNAGNPACAGVPATGPFSEPNGQVTGRIFGNSNLVPETGKVLTYGAIYDPSWLNGLSLEADFWHYEINNTIEVVDVNTTANICFNTGDPTFCNLIVRDPSNGVVDYIDQPVFNLGTLKSNGLDLGFKYNLPNTFMGQGRFGLDATYIDKWERNQAPGFTQPQNVAGQYSKQDGNYSRVRAIGFAQWKVMDFDALITPRYISHITLYQADGALGTASPPLNIGSVTYWNVSLGYDLARYKTSFRVGADNLFDKQPPLLYQNNVINANTDVGTYDTVGAYLWATVTKNF